MIAAMPLQQQRWCLDPGWLFVVAGLALCASVMLVPAQIDVEALRAQRSELVRQHQAASAQVRAHEAFLEELRRADPAVVRRLAAAQLNLLPAGATPVLVASSREHPVGDWIAETVPVTPVQRLLPPDTWLTRLTGERFRLWVLAGGLLAVFMGLLAGPDTSPVSRNLIPRWRPDVFHPQALSADVDWEEEDTDGEDEMDDEVDEELEEEVDEEEEGEEDELLEDEEEEEEEEDEEFEEDDEEFEEDDEDLEEDEDSEEDFEDWDEDEEEEVEEDDEVE
jgi:hypothetical protein